MIEVEQNTVIRTERGLTINGTRITLYDVLGYLKQDWSPKLVRDWLNLTEKQMLDVLDYIESHRQEVEAEYEQVLANAEKNRAYWENVKREKVKELKENPEYHALYQKLKKQKAKLGLK